MSDNDWLWVAFGCIAYLVYELARRVVQLEADVDELRAITRPEQRLTADIRAMAGLPARPPHEGKATADEPAN